MDIHNLTIFEVLEKESYTPLEYKIGEHVENFGSKLDIKLPATEVNKWVIYFSYTT